MDVEGNSLAKSIICDAENPEYLEFQVGNSQILINRSTLYEASSYFKELLSKSKLLGLNDTHIRVNHSGLKLLLEFIDMQSFRLHKVPGTDLVHVLETAQRLLNPEWIDKLENYIVDLVYNEKTLLELLVANLLRTTTAKERFQHKIGYRVSDILSKELSSHALIQLLSLHTLWLPEPELFNATALWLKNHPSCSHEDTKKILSCIHLNWMTLDTLNTVTSSGLFSGREMIAARQEIQNGNKIMDENLAVPRRGITVIDYAVGVRNLFSKLTEIKDFYYIHNGCVHLDLGRIYPINNVRFNIMHIASYWISVSANDRNWKRVINYTHFECTESQNIFFPETNVRYINICAKQTLWMNALEIFCSSHLPPTINGCIVPRDNVLTDTFKALEPGHSKKFTFNQPIWLSGLTCQYSLEFDRSQQPCQGSIKIILLLRSSVGTERIGFDEPLGSFTSPNGWKNLVFSPRGVTQLSVFLERKCTCSDLHDCMLEFTIDNVVAPVLKEN